MPTPEQVFARIATQPGAVWLDGGGEGWSVLAWAPDEVVTSAVGWPDTGRRLSRGVTEVDSDAPFAGGCLGFLGFGAGCQVAPVPRCRRAAEPHVWLGRFAGGLCFRHSDRTWHPAGTAVFVDAALALLASAEPLGEPATATGDAAGTMDREVYRAGVGRILAWIGEGDCYQVNLTRVVHLTGVGDPWQAYRRLRAIGPAPYGAFIRIGPDQAILSNSPELFLEVDQAMLRSRPIKGTRPRGESAAEDLMLLEALSSSPKDRAELTMIVDLVRNDLGRVARTGSVHTSPRQITGLSNVHQAWQEVSARLETGLDAWHAVAASFPPGSVTGAPKSRACLRISELEEEARGVYCGAIGFVDIRGRSVWNVAIRTAVFDGDRARYHVGGAIVAASDPEEEWQETIAKGSLLYAALAQSN